MATQTFYTAGDKKLTAGASTSAIVNEFQLERTALNTAFQAVNDALGAIDHGGLVGLADDDHAQYALSDKSRPATWVEAGDLAARSIADLGTTDHDLLSGLADDDHVQYALADKSRPATWVAAGDLSGRSIADLGTTDHDLLSGLADDDHMQYALADKSRPATWVEAGDLSARALTDLGDVAAKTGTGTTAVFDTSPTIVTPVIVSFTSATHDHEAAAGGGTLDHGLSLTGLSGDDHTQYALLAGRGGSQTLIGGTEVSEDLTLSSTSNVTKGNVNVGTDGSIVEIGSGASFLGFFGTSGVAKESAITALVDSTTGAANDTVIAVPVVNGSGATTAQEVAINDNFADVIAKINAIRSTLTTYGLI